MQEDVRFELNESVRALEKCRKEAEGYEGHLDMVYIDGGAFISESILYEAESRLINFANEAAAIAETLGEKAKESSEGDEHWVDEFNGIIEEIEDAADELRSEGKSVGSYHPDDGPAGIDDLEPAAEALKKFHNDVGAILKSVRVLL